MSSSSVSGRAGQFGPNEWLVEEMYQRFLDDPATVDPAWHDFFADYRPDDGDTPPREPTNASRRRRVDAAPAPSRPPTKTTTTAPGRRRRGRPAATAPRGRRARPVAGDVGAHRPARAQEKPAAGNTSQAARPAPPATRARRRRCAVRRPRWSEHGGVAGGAHGHERARGAGEAARRQPGGDQQPAAADPRREDLVHPSDRVRRGAGAGRLPGDEPALRRGRRQARPWSPRTTSTSGWRSTCPAATGSARWSSCRSRAART